MAYFSNGTEGERYEAQWCDRCVHQDGGCPVWDLHLLYNGRERDTPIDIALDSLIPSREDGLGNEQCAMFIEAKP